MREHDPILETPPGPELAAILCQAAGPGKRYPGLGDDAVVTSAGRWDAVESWAAGQKLAAVRELIRRRPLAGYEPAVAGGLPGVWRKDLTEEVALELGITRTAADGLIVLAWTLQTRLPLAAAALDAGILNLAKARMLADETAVLSDQDAGKAEALIAGQWAGKTWSQLRAKIARAVVNIDPEGAAKRRERAEREEARVRFWREHAGTAGLAGYGLPTDRALKAQARIQGRARAYRAWGIPGTMDQLRVLAYLDLILDTDARNRYPQASTSASGHSTASRGGTGTPAGDGQDSRGADRQARHDTAGPDDDAADDDAAAGGAAGRDGRPSDDLDDADDGDLDDADAIDDGDLDDGDLDAMDDEPGDDGDGPDGDGDGPGGGGPGGTDGPRGGGAGDGLPANLDLTIPMLNLLDLAQRAAEAHGLGVLDPDLARRLAAEAAASPRSTVRVIITDAQGRAIGFGEATRARTARRPRADIPPRPGQGRPASPRDGTPTATFTPAGGTGPPDGYGTWTLTLANQEFTLKLAPIPAGECDHRYESAGYQPSTRLRRLVQIRDGECAMPVCIRHPRTCDFEHAIPWPEGRTCACNGGTHCRRDHRIKQARGWKIQQHPDGSRTWTTPAGLTYTKTPRQYPT